jgi:hypothetical protein
MNLEEEHSLFPIQEVVPRYLNDDLSRGLLLASDNQTIFLILESGGHKWAVIISHPEFRAWRLEKGAKHWEGMFIPDVEVLIDPRKFALEARRDLQTGAMIIAEGEVRIICKPANSMWPEALTWTKADVQPNVEHPRMFFSEWRLGKSDETGRFRVLFEHGIVTEAS